MLFNSLSFLIFFPICIALYFLVPKKAAKYVLLTASLYFYMCWSVKYSLILVASILVTYVAGLLLDKNNDKKAIRCLVTVLNLLVNFGILFTFKYLDFMGSTVNSIVGRQLVPMFNPVLPVGISFYIFQAVGYTIDVYRGARAERNIINYALFVSFFPQLVAGPIERSGNLLKAVGGIEKERKFSRENLTKGAYIMLYGFFLKMIVADRAAILVNTVFDAEKYSLYGGIGAILGAVLFTIQIYGDFAGYTYIAIGAARVLGFKLCENFNTPYLSLNLKDFWDRWHISLSTWFRDYLYFPLGGSRKGTIRKYLNIMIVFLVSGLWHGAAWHFVAWGALHGILRVAGEIVRRLMGQGYNKLVKNPFIYVVGLVKNFVLVTLLWVFFRAESVNQAVSIIKSMVTDFDIKTFSDGSLLNLGLDYKELIVLAISLALMIFFDVLKVKRKDVVSILYSKNDVLQSVFFFFAIITIVIFGVYGMSYDATQFIYFRF